MELSLYLHLIPLVNILFEIALGRPAGNSSIFLGNIIPTKMTDDKDEPSKYEYDDYDTPLESLVNSQSDNSLDTFYLPPDLGISKQTVQVKSDTKMPAPEYMMELYEKFSKNKLNHPSSNIVRSFMNINAHDIQIPFSQEKQFPGATTRFHTMTFNITSISPDETLDLAELRLFTLVEKDRNTYFGIDRKVSCLEVLPNSKEKYRLIQAKHIYGRHSGWETFDVTSAIRRWVTDLNSILTIEIRIESVFHGFQMGSMDINVENRNKNEPLLVVFSSDAKINGLHRTERHELITRELDSVNVIKSSIDKSTNNVLSEHHSVDEQNSALTKNNIHNRKKRRGGRRNMPCHRRPMYISFSDINWDSWIIAPRGYQAYQCVGRCYFPLDDHLSPTKYAIMRGLLNSAYPSDYTRPCCVPTKLDSISILYIDEQGVPTYKYKYDGMVVSECGCR